MRAHVMPVNDLVAHAVDDDCVCGPRTEIVIRPDGASAWLTVHHSLDGREQQEV